MTFAAMSKEPTAANFGSNVSFLPTSAASKSTPPRYRPVANVTVRREIPNAIENKSNSIRGHERGSRYVSAHVAEPCTLGSLIHSLDTCGHKVITDEPEDCASNCMHDPKSKSESFNHRISPKPFICWVCVKGIINEDFEIQRAAYERLLHKLKHQSLLSDARYEVWSTSESIWVESANEITTFVAASGRPCKPISGEPFSDIPLQIISSETSIDHNSEPQQLTAPLQAVLKTRMSRLPRMEATSETKP